MRTRSHSQLLGWGGIGLIAALVLVVGFTLFTEPLVYHKPRAATGATPPDATSTPTPPPTLDRTAYDRRVLALVDYAPQPTSTAATTTTSATGTAPTDPLPSQLVYASSTSVTIPGRAWPPAAPYPRPGAILPFYRVVAYYGNFYSTRMGILGEFASSTVLARLASTSAAYEAADPDTPVMPAIHYIAMVAQGEPGADGMYRSVMPDEEIEKAYAMAQEIDGILFIDLQIGLSDIARELPKFRDFLTRRDVHLAIDPEFAMVTGDPPGTVIGSFSAEEINYVIRYLSDIVRTHDLPPKILVVHRFTQNMVQDYDAITPTPEVQVVIHMDGWGSKPLKRGTYRRVIEPEPVQFAGLKIFYKNDRKPPSTGIFTPREALELHPEPIYIQYQ